MTHMKKLLIALILLLSISSIFSQTKVGVELGPSFSNLRGDFLPSTKKAITNLTVGGFIETDINGPWSFKGLVLVERKGYTFDVSDINIFNPTDDPIFINVETNPNTTYLTLAPLMKYVLGEAVQFYINAGPFVGFVLENESPSNSTDFGAIGGIGIQKSYNAVSLFIEGRGSLGLANTFESNLSPGTIKTSAIYILVGIAFDI